MINLRVEKSLFFQFELVDSIMPLVEYLDYGKNDFACDLFLPIYKLPR